MKKVLIVGGTGSLGQTLIRHFAAKQNCVIAYSRDEAKHWTIKNELLRETRQRSLEPLIRFVVGDIRDKKRLSDTLHQHQPDTVIVAAALKQVDTCEMSPYESVMTNLIGTENVTDVVEDYARGVERVITLLFVSTDKACAPVNVYGMCKAVSERLVTSRASKGLTWVRPIGVRYGNVLESRGSIIPLFKYQAEKMDAITITHRDMTRFLMTLDESVQLIQRALDKADPGDIFVPRLRAMRIGDLADIFADISGKPVTSIGIRPGEKMDEALINASESLRTVEVDGDYVIKPAYSPPTSDVIFEYTSSDDVMTKDRLKDYLESIGVLDRHWSDFVSKSIEEIRQV